MRELTPEEREAALSSGVPFAEGGPFDGPHRVVRDEALITAVERIVAAREAAAAEQARAEVVAVLADLPTALSTKRQQRGASMRDVAAATGLLVSTVHKAEHGGDVRLSTAIPLLRWIADDAFAARSRAALATEPTQ
jgi:hypothetical protein